MVILCRIWWTILQYRYKITQQNVTRCFSNFTVIWTAQLACDAYTNDSFHLNCFLTVQRKQAESQSAQTLIRSLLTKTGPVVQSIVSLTKSLVNDSLSLLVCLKSSVLIFFAEKMWGAFAVQKLLTFFLAKNGSVFMYNMFEILTSHNWAQTFMFHFLLKTVLCKSGSCIKPSSFINGTMLLTL